MPNLRIEKRENRHVILDENEAVYGKYEVKAEAEVALEGWAEYYRDDA